MAETLILEVNANQFVQAISDGKNALEKLKEEYKNAVAEGDQFSTAAIRAKAAVEAQSKANKQMENALVNIVRAQEQVSETTLANIQAYESNKNTIEDNRKAYNALYAIYRQNPSAQLQQQIEKLSDTLKQQEKVVGDTRRNVGNYAESFKEAVNGLKIGGLEISTITNGLSGMKNGFIAAGGGVQGFSAALATTGIPIIIMGVQKLVDVLSSFEPVAEAVEDAINGITSAWTALISGGSIDKAIASTQEYTAAMRDLEDTQQRFNLQQQTYSNIIDDLLIKSKNVNASGQERLNYLKKASEVEKLSLKETIERTDLEYTKLEKSLKDKYNLREDDLNNYIYGTKEQVLYYDDYLKKTKMMDEKDLQRLQELALEKAKQVGQSEQLQERIASREESVREQMRKQQEAAAAKQKEINDKAEAEKKKYNDNLQKLEDETMLTEKQRIEKSYNDKINSITGNSLREINLRLSLEDDKQRALDDYEAKKKKEKEDKRKAEEDKAKQDAITQYNNAIAYNKQLMDNEMALAEQEITNKEELNKKKLEIQLKFLKDNLAMTKKFYESNGISKEEQASLDALILQINKLKSEISKPTTEKFTLADQLGLKKDQLDAAKESLNKIKEVFAGITQNIQSGYEIRKNEIESTLTEEISAVEQSGASEEEKQKKISDLQKKAAKEKYDIDLKSFQLTKAMQISNAVMNAAQGALAIFNVPDFTWGILTAIRLALVATTAATTIGIIASQQPPPPPKFAEGGEVFNVGGRSHADGGTLYRGADGNAFEVERGEKIFVMKASASKYIDKLGGINQMFGGRSWNDIGISFAADGGMIADGGFVAREAANSANYGTTTRTTVELSLTEFERFKSRRDRSITISDL